MYATAQGADTGVPKSVAKEFVASDKPGKLPEHAKHAIGGGIGLGANIVTHPRFQFGGGMGMSMSMADPPWIRSEQRQMFDQPFHGGLIPSSGAGRTDQLPLSVAAESHVIPAMEVAGLGQGNTLAGARILTDATRIGPYGIPLLQSHRGPGPPGGSPPHPPGIPRGMGYAEGGDAKGGDRPNTSILAAGGEFVVPREDWVSRDEHGQLHLQAGVRTLGEGDLGAGHRYLNNMIGNIRQHNLKFLKSAPKPKT